MVEEAPQPQAGPVGGSIDYRIRQQRLLAQFGMVALKATDLDRMLQDATALCADGLGSRFAKYLDAPDSDNRMRIRAGVGWDAGVVGIATVGADFESPAGYAFRTGSTVISNHLEHEERFRTPDVMARHGVKRAINVLVEASGTRYGVLEADSTDEGKFDEDDLAFMQGFANLIGVAIERQVAREQLDQAVERQELLVREASHRLKNSLAMVSAMLELQMREDEDPRIQRLLGDAQARITAIAQAHDQLWRSKRVGLVSLRDLACGIAVALNEQSPDHQILCEADAIEISADTAIPLGLVLSELVTNAIKYAYANGGPIEVVVRAADGRIELTVRDHGLGVPPGFDLGDPMRTSLGIRMIRSLTRQLRGEIRFERAEPGTLVTLDLPDPR